MNFGDDNDEQQAHEIFGDMSVVSSHHHSVIAASSSNHHSVEEPFPKRRKPDHDDILNMQEPPVPQADMNSILSALSAHVPEDEGLEYQQNHPFFE